MTEDARAMAELTPEEWCAITDAYPQWALVEQAVETYGRRVVRDAEARVADLERLLKAQTEALANRTEEKEFFQTQAYELLRQLADLRDALQRIVQVLGPTAPTCEGCAHEIGDALKTAEAVGVVYRQRKRSPVPGPTED